MGRIVSQEEFLQGGSVRIMTPEEFAGGGAVRREVSPSEIRTQREEADIRSAEEAGALFPARTLDRSNVAGAGLTAGAKSLGNLPISAFQFGKGLFDIARHPIQTVKGIAGVAKGGGEKLGREILERTPLKERVEQVPESQQEQMFNQVGQSLKERFGSLEALERTATNDPFGFGVDVLALITGGSGLARRAGLEGLDVATRGEQLISQAERAIIAPVKRAAARGAISQTEKALNLNPSDIRRIERPNVAGKNPAEWLVEREITGSQVQMAEKLSERANVSRKIVNQELMDIPATFSKGKGVDSAREILNTLKTTFGEIAGNEDIVSRIDTLLAQESYTLSELNDIKRLLDANLKIFTRAGDIKGSATARGLANLRDGLKVFIEEEASTRGFADVKRFNKETQVSVEIRDAINKRLNVKGTNLEFGLRDSIVGVGGFLAGTASGGGFPTNLLIGGTFIATKKVLESSAFRTFLANKLNRLSKAEKLILSERLDGGQIGFVQEFIVATLNEYQQSQQ